MNGWLRLSREGHKAVSNRAAKLGKGRWGCGPGLLYQPETID